jgi:hypothetical protein
MAKDWAALGGDKGKKVDTSRVGRALKLGKVAARFTGSMLKAGLTRKRDENFEAMAEAAVLSGDTTGAEALTRDALKLLDEVLVGQPDNSEAVSRKAAQLGLRAGNVHHHQRRAAGRHRAGHAQRAPARARLQAQRRAVRDRRSKHLAERRAVETARLAVGAGGAS